MGEEILELLLLEQKLRELQHLKLDVTPHISVPVKELTDLELANAIDNLERKIAEEEIISENLGSRDDF